MTKEKLFSEITRMIQEGGFDDWVSISETPNKLADFMVYEKDREEMFASRLCGEVYFTLPFDDIQNVLYEINSNQCLFISSESTGIKMTFELRNGCLLYVEISKNDGLIWYVENRLKDNNVFYRDEDVVRKQLNEYNLRFKKRHLIDSLIDSLLYTSYDITDFSISEFQSLERLFWEYMSKNDDAELLFNFTISYLRLGMYIDINDEKNLYVDFKKLISYIKEKELKDEFLYYIEEYEHCARDDDNAYFAALIDDAMKYFDEV